MLVNCIIKKQDMAHYFIQRIVAELPIDVKLLCAGLASKRASLSRQWQKTAWQERIAPGAILHMSGTCTLPAMCDNEAGIVVCNLARSLELCRKHGEEYCGLRCCAFEHPAAEKCGVVQLREILLGENMRNILDLLC